MNDAMLAVIKYDSAAVLLKEIPHKARGPLAGEFQPLAACKNLDYPPGNLRFLQLAID